MDLRKSSLLILLVLLAGTAAGEVQYEVDANRDRVLLNTTVQLECSGADCPVSSWTLTLDKPGDANVTDVEALRGDLENYEIHGDKILVQTKSKRPTEKEIVRISYRTDKDANEVKDGLYSRTISLPGFSGKTNSGTIKAENLIAGFGSYSFQTQKVNDTFKFNGSGPARVKISFGEGYETKYYEFFGAQPEKTDMAYEVTVGTLGFGHRADKLPAAVLPNKEYNETVNRWSSGRFIDGNIVLREDLDEDFLPVLAHETVHAFNEQRLKWDQTSSSWFDEGVAKYTEFLVKNATTRTPNRQLFGEDVSYVRMENGNRYRYTLPPKGGKEQLWYYYQQDKDFMMDWNSNSQNRDFGYAYSELIVRNYVSQNNSLSELYDQIEDAPKVENNREKWDYYSEHLELRPCDYESRKSFEACIDRVNSYNYTVYTAEPADNTQELNITELEVPNRSGANIMPNGSIRREEGFSSLLLSVLNEVGFQIRNILGSL